MKASCQDIDVTEHNISVAVVGSGKGHEFKHLTKAQIRAYLAEAGAPAGDGGEQFREAMSSVILPALDTFAPDLVIFCAGFDAHVHDPLGGLRFVEEDFRDVTLRVMEIAARRCNGRIVSLLEGGYAPNDLAASVVAHVGALMTA